MNLDYVGALEYGLPSTGGMGIDRLVILLTDQESIQEVILYTQMKNIVINNRRNHRYENHYTVKNYDFN